MTTVVGFFKNISEVTKAVQILKRQGFDSAQINLRTNPKAAPAETEPKRARNETITAAAAGAVSGATIGLFLGIIWGVKTMTLPFAGAALTGSDVASFLTSVATGVGLGAIVGSLLLLGIAMLARPVKEALFTVQGSKSEGLTVAIEVPEEQVLEVKKVLDEAKSTKSQTHN